MSSSDHIEVASDLIDQGVFMMRNDVAHWVMANAEDRYYLKLVLFVNYTKIETQSADR